MLHFSQLNIRIIINYKNQTMNRRNWTQYEDQALKNAVDIIGNEDWTKISTLLRETCQTANEAKRTGKQCRQRWYNHLDPAVSKEPWKEEEQARLFEIHKAQGNKWKEISKYLPGRTDNDIKNRFYSTLRRSLRRLNKFIGQKNSTSHMRQIRPSVLTIIINFIYENESGQRDEVLKSLRELPELIFKFASFKPVKNNMKDKINEEIKQKINIILGLVDQFKQLSLQISELYGQKKITDLHFQPHSEQVKKEENSGEISSNHESQGKRKAKMKENLGSFTAKKKNPFEEKKPSQITVKKEEDIVKIQEDEKNLWPIMHPFEENPHESMMSLEEPSLSATENLMGFVVVGKHIEPEYQPDEGRVFEHTSIDEILQEHYEQ